jgi:CRP-like cAMP-binding protein
MHPQAAELAAIPLFAGLTDDQLASLAPHFEVGEFDAGHRLTRAGAHGYAFFVVAEGSARVEIDGEVVNHLTPGSTFGEMAFFASNSRRTADVIPDSPIRVFSMFGLDFRGLQQDYPEVAARIEEQHHELAERDRARHAGPADA